MALPVASDVTSFLAAMGVTVSGIDTQITEMIAFAVDEVEERTGYRPFVAAAATTRFQANDQRALWSGVFDVTSVKIGEQVLAAGTDYQFGPVNRLGTTAEPYEWIKLFFAPRVYTPLAITGRWGFADDYPALIKSAMVRIVAGRVLEGIRSGQLVDASGAKWSEADVSSEAAGTGKLGSKSEEELAGGSLIAQGRGVIDGFSRKVGWG